MQGKLANLEIRILIGEQKKMKESRLAPDTNSKHSFFCKSKVVELAYCQRIVTIFVTSRLLFAASLFIYKVCLLS